MVSIFKSSMHGDGINFSFFQQLWQNNRNEGRGNENKFKSEIKFCESKRVSLRLPDTIIFQLGQPLQWYFTSERGEQSTILRKRRQNVNVEKIEEVFLKKARSSSKGFLHKDDIVAYFISSNECTLRNRRKSTSDETSHYVLSQNEHRSEEDNGCDIEFFNEKSFRDFLHHKRKNQSGILQRFVEPSGGGTHNSQVRAICTPKMCVLERRKTKQELHDTRFGLYERAITFEGPEVYSTALPLRGEMLAGKLRSTCEKVLYYFSRDIMNKRRSDIRMVLNLKVDSNEKIWLLYSSSIRNPNTFQQNFPSISTTSQLTHSQEETALNLQNVIKFSPNIKLNQTANHDPDVALTNKRVFLYCPSCGSVRSGETFHPVPYKTLITHFEQVMSLCNKQWPPPKDIINAAGGVGFGSTSYFEGKLEETEECIIPPVIQHFHTRLKAEGYRRYRADPLFLHKQCNLCENCFLTYANLASSSFQIKMPINLDTDLKKLQAISTVNKSSSSKNKRNTLENKLHKGSTMNVKQIESSFGSEILLPSPSLPSAIVAPPISTNEEDLEQLMPLPYETIESPSQPLHHLLDMYKAMEKSHLDIDRQKLNKQSKQVNPYKIPLTTLIDPTIKKKKVKKIIQPREEELSPEDDGSREIYKNRNSMKSENDIKLLSNALKHYDSVK